MAPRQGKTKPGKDRGLCDYRIEHWIDYVRGLIPASETAQMTSHARDCAECRELMGFYAKLAAAAHFMPHQPSRHP